MDQTAEFKAGFVAAWFATTLTTFLFAVCFSLYLNTPKTKPIIHQSFRLYAALPQNSKELSQEVVKDDGRTKIVEDFFKKYKSPLATYSHAFIKAADKYELDYALLPAISMQESNGGKKVIEDSNNPFGYGIYGKKVLKFSSWEEAIERVGKALREDYLKLGLTTPFEIMAKYTPPSLEKGGVWAKGVSAFMEELR